MNNWRRWWCHEVECIRMIMCVDSYRFGEIRKADRRPRKQTAEPKRKNYKHMQYSNGRREEPPQIPFGDNYGHPIAILDKTKDDQRRKLWANRGQHNNNNRATVDPVVECATNVGQCRRIWLFISFNSMTASTQTIWFRHPQWIRTPQNTFTLANKPKTRKSTGNFCGFVIWHLTRYYRWGTLLKCNGWSRCMHTDKADAAVRCRLPRSNRPDAVCVQKVCSAKSIHCQQTDLRFDITSFNVTCDAIYYYSWRWDKMIFFCSEENNGLMEWDHPEGECWTKRRRRGSFANQTLNEISSRSICSVFSHHMAHPKWLTISSNCISNVN